MAATTDSQKAIEALTYFHNRMLRYNSYNFSFQELQSYIEKIKPNFFSEFGKALSYNSGGLLTPARIKGAMEGLADASKGQLPGSAKDLLDFWDALYSLTTPSIGAWKTATTKAVTEVASDVKSYALIGLGTTTVVIIAAAIGYLYFMRR